MSRETIRQRVAAATEGPWDDLGHGAVHTHGLMVDVLGARHIADAAFIAHARQDIPALLAVADAAAELLLYPALPMDREDDDDPTHAHPVSVEDMDALRAALAALEAVP